VKIVISYCYKPFTTAVYFEKAFSKKHETLYFGPPDDNRNGYSIYEDLDSFSKKKGSPDFFLYIEPAINHFPRGIENLKCPTACYLIDVHRALWVRERLAYFFDYIFIAQKDYVQHFKDMGFKNVYWLPLGCDPDIHGSVDIKKEYDVCFIGKKGPKGNEREKILNVLSQKFKMNALDKWYNKEEIAKVYGASKIVVNIPVNNDLNMRVFEAMAGGALLITKKITNGQRDLFEPDKHLIEYENAKDLIGKIKYYLDKDDERIKVAKLGQNEVLSKHTYGHRCETILKTIFESGDISLSSKIRIDTQKNKHIAYAKVYSMMQLVSPIVHEIKISLKNKTFSFKLIVELGISFLKKMNTKIPLTYGSIKGKFT